ncbi:FAD-dependent oxidoreductase [Thermotalea metallivorans]|uniref:Gamma-glutamylputrescine oxidoreductase n=1 Tax=Thermotalea metallivorans TaxID=520762 RepID=A0A140LAV8_9FIRM|nr:FAD-dependent oxidoreductase [Thermotalea metallivorans]KXG77683.1 Gamma-glutamylputrescine oxidoreductase [Thermotalea metallivorans]
MNKELSLQSYWITSTPQTDYPFLQEDVAVDVAIVGGGMVGITAAWLLKKDGLKVAVIEADRIIQGTTGYTTAKITSQHTLIYDKLKNQQGEEKARQYAKANETAIRFIADLIQEKQIDCDFSWQPSYVYTQSEQYVEKIAKEAEVASGLGIRASYLEELPLPFPVKAAVRFDNQAQFHPRKYLLALSKEIPGQDSYIFEQTRAMDIQPGNPSIILTNRKKKVTAQKVIIASHYPFYDRRGLYFARIFTDRAYVLAAKIKEHFPGGMYINAEQPTRSLRSLPTENGELVMFIGDHHKTGQGENTIHHYENLKSFAQEIYTVEDIPYRWSTQDCMTLDGVPYIGHLTSFTPNLYVATGFGKWGMTNSTASAMILRDLIVKGENPWSPVYDPSRFTPMASAKNFIMENFDVAEKFIAGKIAVWPEDVEINRGEGKIMEIDGQRVGAYRDEEGKLHLVDTTCTHLGCELQWNAAEKSWDCPCHGSRYTYEGNIVEGPTTKPLTKIPYHTT